MSFLLKEIITDKEFELLIDSSIFEKNIILKAAYCFLDKWYFLFKKDENNNIILNFIKKDWVEEKTKKIILDFTDELLNTTLRKVIETENREIKNMIFNKALSSSLDSENYVQFSPTKDNIQLENEVDEILDELANDPELKIDEEEMKKIIASVKNN